MIQSIQRGMDVGIIDCMHIKMDNITTLFTQKRKAYDEKNDYYIEHFPYEIAGGGFSFDVRRQLADVEAGKHMSFLKLISGIDQLLMAKGQPLPTKLFVDQIVDVGRNIGVSGLDDLKKQLAETPPAIPGMPGAGAPGELPNVGTEPNMDMGVMNAMAAAA
jgi:hypothetical protein